MSDIYDKVKQSARIRFDQTERSATGRLAAGADWGQGTTGAAIEMAVQINGQGRSAAGVVPAFGVKVMFLLRLWADIGIVLAIVVGVGGGGFAGFLGMLLLAVVPPLIAWWIARRAKRLLLGSKAGRTTARSSLTSEEQAARWLEEDRRYEELKQQRIARARAAPMPRADL